MSSKDSPKSKNANMFLLFSTVPVLLVTHTSILVMLTEELINGKLAMAWS